MTPRTECVFTFAAMSDLFKPIRRLGNSPPGCSLDLQRSCPFDPGQPGLFFVACRWIVAVIQRLPFSPRGRFGAANDLWARAGSDRLGGLFLGACAAKPAAPRGRALRRFASAIVLSS